MVHDCFYRYLSCNAYAIICFMKRRPNGGYTIIEVMIFLLISSALLGSTTIMLSGRQERIRFTNAVESFDTKFKDLLNDVSTGYYPTDQSFSCKLVGPPGSEDITFPPLGGPAEQGTNTGCLFLGRATQLTPGRNFDTFTIVGSQNGTDLTSAKAELLGAGSNAGVGVVARDTFDADLEIVRTVSLTDSTRQVLGIAMISEFSQTASVTNKVTGNAAHVTLYEVLAPGTFEANAGKPDPAMKPADKGVLICLQQGGVSGNGRKAAIIIGGNGQQFSTETKIDEWPSGC